ncbi:Crp/Fnr family transcriptional regulator [Bacillaceae bacterium W0354]
MHKYSPDFYRKCPIFRGLTEEELWKIADISIEKRFDKNEYIFHEGDERKDVFFIVTGLIKIFKISENGEEQIINILHSNEMFPHAGFFEDSPYPATAETLTEVTVLAVPIERFEELLVQRPGTSIKVMREVGKKLIEIQERLRSIQTQDVSQRIIATLVQFAYELGEREENSTVVHLHIPITNAELASLVGVSRETVNRVFNKLKKDGIMTYNRQEITIHCIEGLKSYMTCPRNKK